MRCSTEKQTSLGIALCCYITQIFFASKPQEANWKFAEVSLGIYYYYNQDN